MQEYQYQSELARRYFSLGFQNGLKIAAGLLALQSVAIAVAKARLEEISAEEEAAIRSLSDESALTALIIGLSIPSTPEQARALLAQPAR
jgi:hypothetical protein